MRFPKAVAALMSAMVLTGCSELGRHWGGNFAGPPAEMESNLSPVAKELISEARHGLSKGAPFNHHTHVLGLGTSVQSVCPEIHVERSDLAPNGAPVWLNPAYLSWIKHPLLRFKFEIFASASGIRDISTADAQYLERLVDLVRYAGGTHYLYAFDWRYDGDAPSAVRNTAKSDLFVDNTYIVRVTRCLNRRLGRNAFIPVASIHPNKSTAVNELNQVADMGVRYLKWLPSVQSIDPADPKLVPFYRTMRKREIILLSHTGKEHTFRVERDRQDYDDPLRLMLPLKEGVVVVMLHSGRDGQMRSRLPNDRAGDRYFDRFIWMMERYKSGLYGEISALPYLGTHKLISRILTDKNLRCRIVDGMDYPIPAVALVNPTGRLFRAGFLRRSGDVGWTLSRQRREALDQIYSYNPILFDFVLKRSIRTDGLRFADSTFSDLGTKMKDAQSGCD